jgi:arginine/lysine/ornithine decarboxylase
VTQDQHATPYLDALLRHRERGFVTFTTPGHKHGQGAPAGMVEAFGMTLLQADVPMAGGVEDTRESTGLVAAAERLAAEAWGAECCFFLVNGSTGGVQSLVITLAGPGDTLIVPRNSHKSLLAGLIFSGAMPHYVEPSIDPEWGVPRNITNAAAAEALRACPAARGFFVTSPTYNGFGADLTELASLVHQTGLPYIVDQAWGPHFRFCSRLPVDAMSAGADAAVTSTHKLISGLTQSSVLMANGARINLPRLSGAVKMTQSTSPQAIIYASIDAARMQMATEGEALWTRALELAEWARERVNEIPGLRCLGHECLEREGIASFDASRLTITACALGHTGWELDSILRDDYGIAVEAADTLNVVLNVTHGDTKHDVERLVAALTDYAARYRGAAQEIGASARSLLADPPGFTRQELSPQDAYFAPSVALALADCVGRVSAEIVTPYPPGIPVLGPGEVVSDEIVAYLTAAGAHGLHVHGPEDLSLRTLRVVE